MDAHSICAQPAQTLSVLSALYCPSCPQYNITHGDDELESFFPGSVFSRECLDAAASEEADGGEGEGSEEQCDREEESDGDLEECQYAAERALRAALEKSPSIDRPLFMPSLVAQKVKCRHCMQVLCTRAVCAIDCHDSCNASAFNGAL